MAFDNILIGLPSTSQSIKSGTTISIAQTVRAIVAGGRNVDLHNIDSAEIVTARDMFANMVLHSDRWDSLLFVDSDMAFRPELILRMIALNEPLTGAAYTRRQLDLDQFARAKQETGDPGVALARASSFTLLTDWQDGSSTLEMREGFASMAAVGMGCSLIHRNVFTSMIEAKVVRPRLDLSAGPDRTCWSFFENIEVDGVRLGEDYSFCHHWTASMGQKLWVCVDETLSHVGSFEYRARYGDLIAPEKSGV